jgi:DNA-binding winged helix-turn-helix (wHTH) protein/Tol biopolymer transport system component
MTTSLFPRFGPFILDVAERRLLRDGCGVPLTPKTFDLLAALLDKPDRLLTKDELLQAVWPDAFVEESNLAYNVSVLRKVLGETTDGGAYIETVAKRGYRFVAPVTFTRRLGPEEIIAADDSGVIPDHGMQPEPDHHLGKPAADEVQGSQTLRRPMSTFSRRTAAVGFIAGVCVTAAVAWTLVHGRRSVSAVVPVRVQISPGMRLAEGSAFSISPDGRLIVFAGAAADSVVRLWIRRTDALEAQPLPGTEIALGGLIPPMFWSPDSRFIAFDASGQLKKVDVEGGAPQTVCDLPGLAVGGAWNRQNVIIVGSPQGGVMRCPASGGPASIVTRPDASRGESAHVFPSFLPDGRHFLYLSVSRSTPEHSGIYVRALDTDPGEPPSNRILPTGFGAVYVADTTPDAGHLLFLRGATLFAQPFDAQRYVLIGDAVRIAEPVGSFLDSALFAASSGLLVFRGPDQDDQLTCFDRRGNILARVGEPGRYSGLTLGPGGTRAVVVRRAQHATADQDLWLLELADSKLSRLTFDARLEQSPVWSADGRRIIFTAGGGLGSLFEQSMSGAEAHLLLKTEEHKVPTSESRDGRFLLYTTESLGLTRRDVWVLPLSGDRQPFPFLRREFDQEQAQFSPDGRWVAYVSNESGRQEVLIRPFAPTAVTAAGESAVVSAAGGTAPRWRGDGRELFYVASNGTVTSVAVATDHGVEIGPPKILFQIPGAVADWDVTGDGERFLVAVPRGDRTPPFTAVFNWQPPQFDSSSSVTPSPGR